MDSRLAEQARAHRQEMEEHTARMTALIQQASAAVHPPRATATQLQEQSAAQEARMDSRLAEQARAHRQEMEEHTARMTALIQ